MSNLEERRLRVIVCHHGKVQHVYTFSPQWRDGLRIGSRLSANIRVGKIRSLGNDQVLLFTHDAGHFHVMAREPWGLALFAATRTHIEPHFWGSADAPLHKTLWLALDAPDTHGMLSLDDDWEIFFNLTGPPTGITKLLHDALAGKLVPTLAIIAAAIAVAVYTILH